MSISKHTNVNLMKSYELPLKDRETEAHCRARLRLEQSVPEIKEEDIALLSTTAEGIYSLLKFVKGQGKVVNQVMKALVENPNFSTLLKDKVETSKAKTSNKNKP